MSIVEDTIKKVNASKVRGNPILRQQLLNSIDDNNLESNPSVQKKENTGYYNSKRWKDKCFDIRYNTIFKDEFDE